MTSPLEKYFFLTPRIHIGVFEACKGPDPIRAIQIGNIWKRGSSFWNTACENWYGYTYLILVELKMAMNENSHFKEMRFELPYALRELVQWILFLRIFVIPHHFSCSFHHHILLLSDLRFDRQNTCERSSRGEKVGVNVLAFTLNRMPRLGCRLEAHTHKRDISWSGWAQQHPFCY